MVHIQTVSQLQERTGVERLSNKEYLNSEEVTYAEGVIALLTYSYEMLTYLVIAVHDCKNLDLAGFIRPSELRHHVIMSNSQQGRFDFSSDSSSSSPHFTTTATIGAIWYSSITHAHSFLHFIQVVQLST